MNAIGDDIRAHATIRKHRTQNARTAMIQRTHGIKCVRSVPRSRGDSAFGRRKIGVGMSEAHANTAPRRFGNDFGRVLQFGSNGHHSNTPARRLPELLKQGQRRSQQIFRWMYPSTRMADERPLKMDAKREGPNLAISTISFAL